MDLGQAEGPAGRHRALSRPGRNSLDRSPWSQPRTEVMVDTVEQASDVAGLLNWCGVHELDLVADGREGGTAVGRRAVRRGPDAR